MKQDKKFWLKMILFLLFSLIIPCTYLSIRFNLFRQKTTITLWAVILVGVIISIVVLMMKYWLSGMKTKYSLLKQIVQGVIKVILPLIIILLATVFFKNRAEIIINNSKVIIEALGIIIVCEAVAIVVDPLPEWAFNNNVEGLSEIVDKVFKKGETE